MTKRQMMCCANRKMAREVWGKLSRIAARTLDQMTEQSGLSVAGGELSLIDGRWYATHAGLLRLANRSRCSAIKVHPVRQFCDPGTNRWVFKATVYKSAGSKGFVGYGDADPSNVSPMVRGAEMRVAETRAVNRALRKAYGIGLCSVEELGSFSAPAPASHPNQAVPASGDGNGFH